MAAIFTTYTYSVCVYIYVRICVYACLYVCLPACLPACLSVYYVFIPSFVQEWTFTTFVSETTVLCEVPEGRITYTVGLGGASTTLMYVHLCVFLYNSPTAYAFLLYRCIAYLCKAKSFDRGKYASIDKPISLRRRALGELPQFREYSRGTQVSTLMVLR